VFFSEYGCNTQSPRPFDEVQAIYGPDMIGVFSGGLVYEYSQEVSNFGLVIINSDGSVKLRPDHDNLQQQYNKLNITLLTSGGPTGAVVTPPACSSSLVDSTDFPSSFDIPNIPDGGQELIDNGVKNPNQGKLVPVTDTKVTQIVEGSNGGVINGLAIQPLSDNQSNTPSGQNTSGEATGSSTAASPKSTKKGAGSKDGVTWVMFWIFVGSAFIWCL
jgi:1,3-beta-glucanosyltransferase GAS3